VVERICVAQIGAAHGVGGEVRLWSFTTDPMAVGQYAPLETEDGTLSFAFEALRQAKDHLVAKIAGIDSRDAAEALTNLRLYVPRERLPENEDPETYYHADLIGLAVVATDGSEIGNLVAIHNFGAGDILEVRPKAGGPTIMLPFTDAVVPEIDLGAGRIVVAPPEGTLSGEAIPESPPPLQGRPTPKAPGGR
jgi:16S rRNA processing protein RimM